MTSAEARFNNSLRPRKPEGSLGRTAQDGHLDSHTAPELCLVDRDILLKKLGICLKNSSSLPFFKSYLHNRTQCVLLHGSYSSKESIKSGVPQGSVLGPILFSLFINDLPSHVKDISVDCDMLADDTTLHTSGKDIMQIRSNMQDSLDQVSNWCDNNHMVINPIKTKSMIIATRQKHQLSPLPLDLVLNGAKIDQVSGITIDNKLRWDSHINNVCKTVSRRVFLLSKLRYIVNIDTRKLFFNAHIKPHTDYASVVWDGCSDLKKRLNSLHRRAVKFIFPDTTPTTDQKLKEMRIMSLQKQLEYNKGLFVYRVLSNEAPGYISNLYTHTPSRYSNSRNYHRSLPRPRIDIFKTSIFFSGVYLWNNLPLTVRSCQSLSSFKRKLRAHLEVVT